MSKAPTKDGCKVFCTHVSQSVSNGLCIVSIKQHWAVVRADFSDFLFLSSCYIFTCILCFLLPATLRAAQICRYLVYSEADFEVFRPAGATRCTDAGEIWHAWRSPPPCRISPPSVQRQGCRTPKLKFLLRFDRNLEYKRPAGAYTLRDFHKICRACTSFQAALGVKIWLDLLKGLWSYGGFKLMVSGSCQIFSGP